MESTDTETDPQDLAGLHKRILKNIKESRAHFSEWRTQAREDYGFFAGEQWDSEDKAILEEQGRAAVVFNRVARTVNAVAGLELQNRQEVRYLPRELGDSGLSDTLSEAAKWVRDSCDAEDEESESFQDAVICGQGWTETRLEYETDPEGLVLIERRDPFEMGVDPRAKKRNFDDMRYVFRIIDYGRDEYEAKFPDKDLPASQFFGSSDDESQPHENNPLNAYDSESTSADTGSSQTYQVCQYQYWERAYVYMVADPSGQPVELPEDRFEAAQPMLDAQGVRYTRVPKRKVYQCFLTATEILEREPAPCNSFTFRAITGLRDRNDNTWFGLVRLMKDPQRWANKWLSQIQHILNTQAKSGKVGFETGAVKDPKRFRAEWADISKPAEFNPGALSGQKFHQFEAARYPEGTDRLLQYAINAVNETTGVNIELLGLADRDQPGVLEESRKKAGVTILANFFDGLRRYRKEQGRVLAHFIQDYLADGRLIRIVGEDGAQYVPLLKDKLSLKYDLIVDDAPSSPNMKERVYQMLLPILDTAMKAGIPVPPDVLDYSPLPDALTQKWKRYIKAQGEDPIQQQMKQLQVQDQDAEVKVKYSQAQLNMAKAQQATTQTEAGPGGEQEIAQAQRELQAKSSIELTKVASNEKIQMTKIAADTQTKRQANMLNAHVKEKTAKQQQRNANP